MKTKYQVFVSSTFEDLKAERQQVIGQLMRMGYIPSAMELFPAVSMEQLSYIKDVIDDCDYYVLIIGDHYGSISAEGMSYTEAEYDYAVEARKQVSVFIQGNRGTFNANVTGPSPDPENRFNNFRRKAWARRIGADWSTPEELAGKVASALHQAAVPATGWVRAGPSERFLAFFGQSAIKKDVELVCCRREAKGSAVFRYQFASKLTLPTLDAKSAAAALIPRDVEAWLAYDDLLVAAKLGRLFGSECNRQVRIALDDNGNKWMEDRPTIAVGLLFTWHTKKLLQAGNLDKKVQIKWLKTSPATYAIMFNTLEYPAPGEDRNVAIVARIVCDSPHVHFICAGHTAAGTAAAGKYLAEKWQDMMSLYQDADLNRSLAILISHPKTFDDVCAVTIDKFNILNHVFE